jgi:RND family efflux transporter MFP subunit
VLHYAGRSAGAFARSFARRLRYSLSRAPTSAGKTRALARRAARSQEFATYASFEAVADRLQKNNARLSRGKAEFLARHWGKPTPGGRVRLASDPRHRLPFPTVYRIEETYAVWRRIAAPALWVVGTESNIPKWLAEHPEGEGGTGQPRGSQAAPDAHPRRPARHDRRRGPHAASRSAGSGCGGDRRFRRKNSSAVECGGAGVPAGAFSRTASRISGMESPASPDITKLRIDRSLAPIRASRRRRWLWIAGLAVVAVAGAAWYALQPRAISAQTTAVVTSYPSQQFVVLNATGYVVAQRKAAIASKATGRLEWLGVAEGSRVKAGEVIARLDSRDVVAQAQSARGERPRGPRGACPGAGGDWEAATALKRNQDLLAKGFVSQSVVDTSKARADRATAGVANARATIGVAEANARNAEVAVDYTHIRAPFDGVIVSKSANVGDMVTPFSSAADSKGAVVNMADMSTLEVEADVSESSLARIKVGQPCEITLDALPDARFRGRVSRWCRRWTARRRRS